MKVNQEKVLKRWILMGVFLGLYLVTILLVLNDWWAWLDDPIRNAFYDMRSEGLNGVVITLTQLGSTKVIVVLLLALIIIPQTRLRFGIPTACAEIAALICHLGTKALIQRERPSDITQLTTEVDSSFPSGHSTASLVVYGVLCYLILRYVTIKWLRRLLAILCAVIVLIVPMTRIYLGMHFPSDVLGGWFLGLAVIMAFLNVYNMILNRKKRKS